MERYLPANNDTRLQNNKAGIPINQPFLGTKAKTIRILALRDIVIG
jgi:hypothetical protein